jgi:Protein of unknown function (DUF3396)
VTRAMQLGREKHALALQCTGEKLDALIPGRFSLEQRYRYDPQTGQKQLISPEETQTLRQHGCGDELEGTIVPDVVIHPGNPLEVLAVYDFKFPCPISNRPRWRSYPKGHPKAGSTQGDVYLEFLGVEPNMEGERAVVTLGEWPEAGDTEQGRDLPLHRELARVLEPWLYQRQIAWNGFTLEDMRRWERRFLD